jgi:hypothetical protein
MGVVSLTVLTIMTSPSVPYIIDSSSIMAFTTMMLSIDQIILWIGFLLDCLQLYCVCLGRIFV